MSKCCQHPRLRSFTFSSSDTMTMCPDCSYGTGHCEQTIPSGENFYSTGRTKAFVVEIEDEPEADFEVLEMSPPSFGAIFDEQELERSPEADDYTSTDSEEVSSAEEEHAVDSAAA